MSRLRQCALGAATLLALSLTPASAQQDEDGLTVYFDLGSARVAADQRAVLDRAAEVFRDGSPIVMIVAGGADTVGPAAENLALSLARAQSVVGGLTQRGIPVERLQVVGLGNSELRDPTPDGVPSRENRVVTITWR